MPRLVFTSHLATVGPRDATVVPGATVGAALAQVFVDFPRLKGYVLDDQGRVRRHVVIFIDNERHANDTVLSRSVAADTEIYVLQALSGG